MVFASTGGEAEDTDKTAQGSFVIDVRAGPDKRNGTLTPDA